MILFILIWLMAGLLGLLLIDSSWRHQFGGERAWEDGRLLICIPTVLLGFAGFVVGVCLFIKWETR